MSYSHGTARYYDLFGADCGAADEASGFLLGLLPRARNVLEIGAGVGNTAFALAAAGVRVTALEPDPEMYSVMLARLALRADLEGRLSPVPRAAGHPIAAKFDLCACLAVLHLLEPEPQSALVSYARARARPGGRVVLEIPVVSAARTERPWERVAQRQFGDVRFEHHTAVESSTDGWWFTHWRFLVWQEALLLEDAAQTFRWRPATVQYTDELLSRSGIAVEAEYAGFDKAPFVSGQSRVRVVVGTTA